MEQRNNEVLPLVQVVKGQEALGRTMSCVSDPQVSTTRLSRRDSRHTPLGDHFRSASVVCYHFKKLK